MIFMLNLLLTNLIVIHIIGVISLFGGEWVTDIQLLVIMLDFFLYFLLIFKNKLKFVLVLYGFLLP